MDGNNLSQHTKPRCLIIGRHLLVLECLHLLLQSMFEVRSATPSFEEALTLAKHFDPQLAVIDCTSPADALDMARRLREVQSHLAVTFLSDEETPKWSTHALSKRCSAAELLQRLRTQAAAASPAADDSLGIGIEQDSDRPLPGAKLSHRELQVLVLLVRGLRMKEVARMLGISPRTVAFHKYRAMEANGLRSQADLLNFALNRGLLPTNPAEQFEPVRAPAVRGVVDTWLRTNASVTSFGGDPGRNC